MGDEPFMRTPASQRLVKAVADMLRFIRLIAPGEASMPCAKAGVDPMVTLQTIASGSGGSVLQGTQSFLRRIKRRR